MARQESDREDLMREATTLVERAEIRTAGWPDAVIAGFRRDGSLSIYFGPDPCYHFDPELRLRRAFVNGDLYRTQGDTLARLTRIRGEAGGDSQVELQRHDLFTEELGHVLRAMMENLKQLHVALKGAAHCVNAIPGEPTLREKLLTSLTSLTSQPLILAPAIRGKR